MTNLKDYMRDFQAESIKAYEDYLLPLPEGEKPKTKDMYKDELDVLLDIYIHKICIRLIGEES